MLILNKNENANDDAHKITCKLEDFDIKWYVPIVYSESRMMGNYHVRFVKSILVETLVSYFHKSLTSLKLN